MDGLHRFSDPQVTSFEELLRLGAEYDGLHPGVWERELALAAPNDLAMLIYTSGTTGPPKGAMISHRNIMFQIANADVFCAERAGRAAASFLPLCHIAERKFSVFYPLGTGAVINFVESPKTVPEKSREVAPTAFFAVPRIWEKFYSGITIAHEGRDLVGRTGLHCGARHWQRKCARQARWSDPSPLSLRLPNRIAD